MRRLIFWPIFILLVCAYAHYYDEDDFRISSGIYVNNKNYGVESLQLQEVMRELRRMKRAAVGTTKPVIVVDASQNSSNTGKCVISADQAVHFCGFAEEVSAPPIPPPQAGFCHTSEKSGRKICYPSYENLDTTCTDAGSERQGLVAPPVIQHATVRSMAFVPPDNLNRLIRQYYRQQGKPLHKNDSVLPHGNAKSFLFVKYHCEHGYEMLDEVDTMFCQNKRWVSTNPVCRGKGLCEEDNGGCSHSCLSFDNRTIECRCPKGMVLDAETKKTCTKPIPKDLCRKLAGCTCAPIDSVQYACNCQKSEKCLLLQGAPKIYLEPSPPFQVEPGGNLNISCSAVAFPFPAIYWQRENETAVDQQNSKPGHVKSEQVLMIKDIYKNTEFTCHASNDVGASKRVVNVVVTGPGSAPILSSISPGRSSIDLNWNPPHVLNRPITSYTVYYTKNGQTPVKSWDSIEVEEPQLKATIRDLDPNTPYTIRIRANDNLGPGKLSNPVTVNTQKPAIRPHVYIEEGEELRVAPRTAFSLGCNVTRGDPIPSVRWDSKGRAISASQESRFITLQHIGLYENTDFLCVATNEAGESSKKVSVIVTGPTAPERIRYHVDGNKIILQWDEPRITNGPIKDYEVLYTDDPSLPDSEWRTAKSGGADTKSITLPDLDERKDYTVKIRGHNENGVGMPSLDFAVTTWLAPRKPVVTLTPPEKIQRAPSTQELEILCDANGVPKPKIVWFWDDVPVEDGKNDLRVFDISPIDALERVQSKLVSQPSIRSGTARCEAINENGMDSGTVPVKILGPGTPPEAISTKPLQDGFTVEWKPPQIPNGNVTKYLIYYTKDMDKELADWSVASVDANAPNELTLKDQEEDTPYGIRMQAISDDGPGIISDSYEVTTGQKHIPLTIKLRVLEPKPEEGDETVVEPKQPIRFDCVAEGRPKPSVFYTWLPFNDSASGEEPVYMHINAIDDPKQHRYQTVETQSTTSTKRQLLCEARNIHGSATDRHVFNVLKPGSPPNELAPIVDLDNRVTISWKPPIHPNGNITKYTVFLSADPSKPLDQWQPFEVAVKPGEEEPKITFPRGDLEPETPYYIRVQPENDFGKGLPSDPIHFVTVSGAPLDAPTDIMTNVALDNTLNISWSPPSQPNGPIKSYTVYFVPVDPAERDDNYKQWPKIEVVVEPDDVNKTGQVTLDKDQYGILPDHDYKVRVSAKNDQSEGPASGSVQLTTGSGEIAPVITLSPNTTSATIDPLADFSATCTADGIPAPQISWSIGSGTERIQGPQLKLGNVVKDTTVTCYADNKAGSDQKTMEILVSGPGTPPNEVVAIPLFGQAINVEWTAPDEPNGPIQRYIVHYGELEEGQTEPKEWLQVAVEGPDQVRHKLTNLKPKTVYAIKVQGVSRGPGVISNTVKAKTLPLAPKAPDQALVVVHDNNTIQVEFDPSKDPNDPDKKIKDYKILYTSGDPLLEDTPWKELIWTLPDDQLLDPTAKVPIDGENFDPETKYSVKVIPRGEIEGLPSDPVIFQTKEGIIPPDKPLVNVDTDNNTIRVPAGSDYTVSCTGNGFPLPTLKWLDKDGNEIGEGGMLRVFDIKETKDAICVAENAGGREETPFQIYVAGPGNAPENIELISNRPKQITVKWDPPTIPNGKITRYIIYYTPLDDQERAFQVGQVPQKPIYEWTTYHMIGENLNEGRKEAQLSDFVTADTAYAVVVQAANEDGAGPYSIQHSIRTMSKAREEPPKELRVEPINQTSVEVGWKPPLIGVQEDAPILSYEIYYIPADKQIEEDEFQSLPKWTKVDVPDPNKLSIDIADVLKPDTEYVFKIRAIYAQGPGVFSEPCITKTLPEGDAPYIVVSAGGRGTTGLSQISLLPGSNYQVFCRANGSPQPSVKWIRGGNFSIDPSTVKSDETGTKWSLNVANITENTTFKCVAENPLGKANWTIELDVINGLGPDWQSNLVTAEKDNNDKTVLSFSDLLPEKLKEPNQWLIRHTDDPNKPLSEWTLEESQNRPLSNIELEKQPEPGLNHYVKIENPIDGTQTPVLSFLVPKPPSEIRVGSNINEELVVDFRPTISTKPVQEYVIVFWPSDNPNDVKTVRVGGNSTSGNVIPDLKRDTDYQFRVDALLKNGDTLKSKIVDVRTPTQEVHCECSHACRLTESDSSEGENSKISIASCYCPDGFELGEDQKTCQLIETPEKESTIVQVSPTFDLDLQKPEEAVDIGSSKISDRGGAVSFPKGPNASPLPTDVYGHAITVSPLEKEDLKVVPTDELGREIQPIVYFNNTPLPTDAYHNTYNRLGQKIARDDENRAIGPDNKPLKVNAEGAYVYPPIDKYGQPIPTDPSNLKPIYTVANADGIEHKKDADGRSLDSEGNPIPTDSMGRPVSIDASPLPTDFYGRFIVSGGGGTIDSDASALPTDQMGFEIYPIIGSDGELLPTAASSGIYLDEHGEEIERNDNGIPVDSKGKELPKNSKGQYVYNNGKTTIKPTGTYIQSGADKPLTQTTINGVPVESNLQRGSEVTDYTTTRPIVVIGPDGAPLPTDSRGNFVDKLGKTYSTNTEGQVVGPDGSLLTKDSEGNYIAPTTSGPIVVIGPDGALLPTDTLGQFVNKDGQTYPTNSEGLVIGPDGKPIQKNVHGEYILTTRNPITVIGPDGSPLTTDSLGHFVDKAGSPYPTNYEGKLIGPDGSPLPTNSDGQYVVDTSPIDKITGKILPTDKSGKYIYSIVGPDGNLLPKDNNGRFVKPDGDKVSLDEFGRPLNNNGEILQRNKEGSYIYEDKAAKKPLVVGPDGRPLPTDTSGNYVDLSGKILPSDSSGRLLSPDGTPLKINDKGQIVVIQGEEDKTTDSSKALTLPTDEYGKLIYPVVDSNGKLLEVDDSGQHIKENGELIDTDDFGRPIDENGKLLPINSKGQYVYNSDFSKRLGQPVGSTDFTGLVGPISSPLSPTEDSEGNIIVPADSFQEGLIKSIYSILRPDGSPLRKNAKGRFIGDSGEVIDLNSLGQPLDPSTKKVLPKNADGNYVYKKSTKPSVISVVGPDGSLLPTDSSGNVLDYNGRPLPTRSDGILIGPDGLPLPTNDEGNLVVGAEDEDVTLLSTDNSGLRIYPIVRPDGSLLRKNPDGKFIDDFDRVIEVDSSGKPLDPTSKKVLPKNRDGKYVYKKPTKISVIGPDGRLLPTDSTGNFVDTEGRPLPTSFEGILIGPDGSPLPTDKKGNLYISPEDSDKAKTLPTDSYGQRIYPIVGPDGYPLKKDYYGKYVNSEGEVIPTDDSGRPLFVGSEKVLPTNNVGEYVYINPATYPDNNLIGSEGSYPNDRESISLDKPDKTCKVSETVADIIFAINNELLISYSNPVKNTIKNFIANEVDLAPDAVRIALLHFGRNLEIPVNLGGYNEKAQMIEKLEGMEHSATLEVPDLLTAYQGAEQQFQEFGRKNTTRILIVFSTGDDIYPFSGKKSLEENSIIPILISLTSYDAEIQDESHLNILVEEWNNLQAETLTDYLENQCLKGNIILPTTKALFVPPISTPLLDSTKSHEITTKTPANCMALQRRLMIILVVETSFSTIDLRNEVKQVLLQFIKAYVPPEEHAMVGLIYYGNTVEVAVDIGNYASVDELEEAVQDMHFVGGEPDAALALRTAQQLFSEQANEKSKLKLVLHIHKTDISPKTDVEIESIANSDSIGVLNFPPKQWPILKSDWRQSHWASRLCDVTSVLDSTATPLNMDRVFFSGESAPQPSPKPTDESGETIEVTAGPHSGINDDSLARILPTDEAGKLIYPVVGRDGQLLPVDDSGRYVDSSGEPIPLDDFGRPLGPDKELLPVNQQGQYVYVGDKTPSIPKPTSKYGDKISVVGTDGIPIPTDLSGNYVDHDNSPLPTDSNGELVDPHGKTLHADAHGRIVVPSGVMDEDSKVAPANMEVEEQGKTLPTDDSGKFIYPVVNVDGTPLKTDSSGRYINLQGEQLSTDDFGRPLDPLTEMVLPRNNYGQYVYVAPAMESSTGASIKPFIVVDGDGIELLPNSDGQIRDHKGNLIATNSEGLLTNSDGRLLATDSSGRFVVLDENEPESEIKTLPTDSGGQIIFPIVNSDGYLLSKDPQGRFVDQTGEPVPRDEFGRPLDKNSGKILDMDNDGNYVLKEEKIKPTVGKVPITAVNAKNGKILSTDSSGNIIDKHGSPYPTNFAGLLIGPDGSPLPTNDQGNFVVGRIGDDIKTLPTDNFGRLLPPIVDERGKQLKKDSHGQFLDEKGEPIELDDSGRPMDERTGQLLPINERGEYVYPMERDEVPTDDYSLKKHTPLDPLWSAGSPLPTDSSGRTITHVTEEMAKTLPTDATGQLLYPIVGADGIVLQKTSDGRYLTPENEIIPLDEFGRPLDINSGQILPRDHHGHYVYSPKGDFNGQILTTIESPSVGKTSKRLNLTKWTPTTLLDVEDEGYIIKRRNESKNCFVSAYIDLLLVYDTSNNVKILDYRIMKEAVKQFLADNFDLRTQRVRVGLLRYGAKAEVEIALGDYGGAADLLSRIGDVRRLKGAANLEEALKESRAEFLLSGMDSTPKVLLVWKSGNSSSGDIRQAAQALRYELDTKIFVVSAGPGQHAEDLELVGDSTPQRILNLPQWRGIDATLLGVMADRICEAVPEARDSDLNPSAWPTRRVTLSTAPPDPIRSCEVIDYEVDLIIALDSSNFDIGQFNTIVEGVGSLVDESFDLSPDVVRIGFIVYSDQVSVPVALGHYEDKIELLQKITDAEKLEGTAIALRGLEAAQQQFTLHARGGHVSKVILLITNGKHRGNAANTAQQIRDTQDVQIFAVAVNPSPAQLSTLQRIVGPESAPQRLLRIESVADMTGEKLGFIRKALCGRIIPAAWNLKGVTFPSSNSGWESSSSSGDRTRKRDVSGLTYYSEIIPTVSQISTFPPAEPLCRDGFLRPYLISVVVDITNRTHSNNFVAVVSHLNAFLVRKFAAVSQLLKINLVTVGSRGVVQSHTDLLLPKFLAILKNLQQERDQNEPAKLGAGINEAAQLAHEQIIPGVNQIILIVSADGLSSDIPVKPTELALNTYPVHLIAISIENPTTDLLKNLADGSPRRVIHMSNGWSISNGAQRQEFGNWLAYAICDAILKPTTLKTTPSTKSPNKNQKNPSPTLASTTKKHLKFSNTPLPKWMWTRTTKMPSTPTDVVLTPISANSISVSWTCCMSKNSPETTYEILYTFAEKLPKSEWKRVTASCGQSHGYLLENLLPQHDYMACVILKGKTEKTNFGAENCDRIWLSKDFTSQSTSPTTPIPISSTINSPCQCLCGNNGESIVPPSCQNREKANIDCKCRIKAIKKGVCENGYRFNKNLCFDTNECAKGNGGCSHACVNIPGEYYCACPHGWMLDPVNPKSCIKIAGSFERIAELLARYFYANLPSSPQTPQISKENGNAAKKSFKASVASQDPKEAKLSFEWLFKT